MKKFRIIVQGRNLLMRVDDTPPRMAFYTNVFVEAITSEEAKLRAIQIVEKDTQLLDVKLNVSNDPLHLSVDEIQETETFDSARLPRQGLIFYPEKSSASENRSMT
jgi:hypothetical protein